MVGRNMIFGNFADAWIGRSRDNEQRWERTLDGVSGSQEGQIAGEIECWA